MPEGQSPEAVNVQFSAPLNWPLGRARTARPQSSRFEGRTLIRACDEIILEVQRLDGWELVISTDVPLRKDGRPMADARISDHGAAIYFRLKDKPIVLACDKWRILSENLWAIAKHIEALRGQDRWGVGSIVQAFAGYMALPAPADLRTWYEVLGVEENAHPDAVRAAYVKAAKDHHPDRGGSAKEMAVVNAAWDAYCRISRL